MPASTYRERARKRLWAADALTIVLVTSVAVAVALFLSDGGAAGFGSFAGMLTSMGVIAGLAAMDLVLVMFLLSARVPIIDRTIGQDKALLVHGSLGEPILYLLLAHGALLLLGYAATEGISPVAEALSLWASGLDLRWAVLSLVLFVLVAGTSVIAVKRRLPQEIWHGIHLLTYAAVALSIPHQFSLSGLFAPGTIQRWYWIALMVLTGAAVLTYRVLLPTIRSLHHQIRITRVTEVAPGVATIDMTGRDVERLNTRAGQYFIWRFLTPDLWWQPHPFSVSARPTPTSLRITVRNLGAGTAKLMSIRPGTKVAIEGPYGIFTEAARASAQVLLIGSGIGNSPIRGLLEDLTFPYGSATVILRASRPNEVYLLDEISALCEQRGARLFVLTGPRATWNSSWLPASAVASGYTMTSYLPPGQVPDVYVCGPLPWTDLVLADARNAGFPSENIHSERFAL
ncbi:oxidoreductase [Arthrobacter sp. Leaf234]|nr:oxidoreductase [Arthrobacter sp. Leaf234]